MEQKNSKLCFQTSPNLAEGLKQEHSQSTALKFFALQNEHQALLESRFDYLLWLDACILKQVIDFHALFSDLKEASSVERIQLDFKFTLQQRAGAVIRVHGGHAGSKLHCCELLLDWLQDIFYREQPMPFTYQILMPRMLVTKLKNRVSQVCAQTTEKFPRQYFDFWISFQIEKTVGSLPQFQFISVKGAPKVSAFIISQLSETAFERFLFHPYFWTDHNFDEKANQNTQGCVLFSLPQNILFNRHGQFLHQISIQLPMARFKIISVFPNFNMITLKIKSPNHQIHKAICKYRSILALFINYFARKYQETVQIIIPKPVSKKLFSRDYLILEQIQTVSNFVAVFLVETKGQMCTIGIQGNPEDKETAILEILKLQATLPAKIKADMQQRGRNLRSKRKNKNKNKF